MKTTIRNKDIKVIVKIGLTQLGSQKPYFSITGEVYPADKPATERNLISCGCCHDDIQAITNEFDDVIALHLSNIDGQPMHSLENGFYHYAEGIKEDGTLVYFKNEEEANKAKKDNKEWVYQEFLKQTGLKDDEFVKQAFFLLELQKFIYDDKLSYCNIIKEIWKNRPKNDLNIVVKRNNKALASHLRISLKEAEAIPAGLTKQQFNERYILPNVGRWKQEADAVIQKYKLTIKKER